MEKVVSLFLLSSIAVSIHGAVIDEFYPYGITIDKTVEIGDDLTSEQITLDMPIVFFGERKYNVWVSTNGLISFDGPLPDYKGELFPLGLEVIAPFYADVDTRSTGDIFYRESIQDNELEQAALDINRVFRPEGRFEPRALFIVTWVDVGSYSQQFEKRNTFQLMVASDGYDSYASFIYLNSSVQWVQAELKDNIPEVAAQAGFDAGSRRYPPRVLPNSGFQESANWDRESNAGMPGVWMFHIGNVRNIEEPDVSITSFFTTEKPQPVTKSPGTSGGQCSDQCSRFASCINGCCQCMSGYTGNGVSCLNETAIRFSGRVIGIVNDETISEESGMHVYIAIDEARSYTAINKLTPLTGYPMQILVSLGELMGWLFADGDELNGFDITGGILNYTATISADGEMITLRVGLLGLNSNNEPNPIMISINGNLPTRTFGSQAIFNDHIADYGLVKPGEYRSESTRRYSVNNEDFTFKLTETINFNECAKPAQVYRVRHSGYYVNYNENELTTRFALVSETQRAPADVCISHDCDMNADCLPTADSFMCVCRQGYDGDGRDCVDKDECANGENTCSPNANCYNTDGGYICQCKTGYNGDGYYCAQAENRITCRDMPCHEDAVCDYRGDEPYCKCKTGFRGDGYRCEAIVTTCNEADICDPNADCVYNPDTSRYECQCRDGFSGDGESCDIPIDASCARCSYNAECVFDVARLYYYCQCKAGYTGDGRTCQLIEPISTSSTTKVSESVNISTTSTPSTVTDGNRVVTDKDSCYNDPRICHKEATCLLQPDRTYKCVCNEGFLGTGKQCVKADCTSHSNCGDNALCQFSREQNKYTCICNAGFEGDGQVCTSTDILTCNELNQCHIDADCYDTASGPKCVCRNGYVGDGISCTLIQDNCMNRPALCDRNAVCTRATAGDYVCICNPGFKGDGTTCTSLNERGDYLLFTQGMSVFRVPFYQAGTERGRRLLHRSGQTLVGLAADCKDRKFYFSDIKTGTISKASLDNATDSHVIISGLKSPEGLAVDWVSRTLFWTDSELDRIEVSDLNGKYRKVIIDSGLVNPRAIVVNPTAGKIYWTDWDRSSPKIEVANMDGTDRRVLVSEGLGLPNGLTYDFYRREICWADASTRKIECINPDGSGRRVVYDLANYPFSITNFRDNYYWTDWNVKSIQTIPRGGRLLGSSIQYPLGGNGKAYSIEPVPSQCLPGTNKCSYNNGGCKHLCLPNSDYQATCACPDNINEDECNTIDDNFEAPAPAEEEEPAPTAFSFSFGDWFSG